MDLVTFVNEPTNLGPSISSQLGDTVNASTSVLRHTDALDVGTTIRLSTIVAVDQVLIDPEVVAVRVRDPQGNEIVPGIFRSAIGTYGADVIATSSGQWRFRWETLGPIAVRSGSFIVRKDIYDAGEIPPNVISDAWGIGVWGSFPWPGEGPDDEFTWGAEAWGQALWGDS